MRLYGLLILMCGTAQIVEPQTRRTPPTAPDAERNFPDNGKVENLIVLSSLEMADD